MPLVVNHNLLNKQQTRSCQAQDINGYVEKSAPIRVSAQGSLLETQRARLSRWLLTGALTLPAWAAACRPSRRSAGKRVFSISHSVQTS